MSEFASTCFGQAYFSLLSRLNQRWSHVLRTHFQLHRRHLIRGYRCACFLISPSTFLRLTFIIFARCRCKHSEQCLSIKHSVGCFHKPLRHSLQSLTPDLSVFRINWFSSKEFCYVVCWICVGRNCLSSPHEICWSPADCSLPDANWEDGSHHGGRLPRPRSSRGQPELLNRIFASSRSIVRRK